MLALCCSGHPAHQTRPHSPSHWPGMGLFTSYFLSINEWMSLNIFRKKILKCELVSGPFPCQLQSWWLLISSEHVFVILFWARQMKMWMSKPTKTAFFSLIISSFLVGVTSCPHFLHSQRKSLELDLGKINNNFTGGIIAVYWDLGLTANTVLRATLAVVLRTKCETQWNYHYVTRPDGVRANRSDNREGQCIWWCHGMSGSKVAFKCRTVFF